MGLGNLLKKSMGSLILHAPEPEPIFKAKYARNVWPFISKPGNPPVPMHLNKPTRYIIDDMVDQQMANFRRTVVEHEKEMASMSRQARVERQAIGGIKGGRGRFLAAEGKM